MSASLGQRLVVYIGSRNVLVGIEDPQLVVQRQINRGRADGILVIGLYLYPAAMDLPENFGFRQDHLERSLETIFGTPAVHRLAASDSGVRIAKLTAFGKDSSLAWLDLPLVPRG